MRRRARAYLHAVTLLSLAMEARTLAAVDVQLVVGGLNSLVDIQHAGDSSGRLFLVLKGGQIRIYDGAQLLPTPFLDLSGIVATGGERGLLGLAFHPGYAGNGHFYVHYTIPAGSSVVAGYTVSADPNVADEGSATTVLSVSRPATNHNGGQIRFGPDGFLYVALGDGGSSGDAENHGQRLDSLLGKVLRLDIDSATPYAIPPSNPFASQAGTRGEIWALGLRNPWRFSFDRMTGDLFVGDVGQNTWEEINVELAGGAGGRNYGWRRMEAEQCFDPSTSCDDGTLTLPVVAYPHTLGCSVTAGLAYRGTALSGVTGALFFGDFCTGRLWAGMSAAGAWTATEVRDTSLAIAAFGEDEAGEFYLAHYASSGALYRLVTGPPVQTLRVSRLGSGAGRVTTAPVALDCGTICGADYATAVTVTLIDAAAAGSAFVGYTGDPDCADGVVTLSADRTCTAVFGTGFTDEDLAPGFAIKAVHVTELRARIDMVRTGLGLGPFVWTVPGLAAGSVVRATHFTELRQALAEAYGAAGLAPPPYTDPALAAGVSIKATHVTELRAAVVALE